jgi:hypothetical protein
VYDLDLLRASGVDIIEAQEFWKLRECGLLTQTSTFLPGGSKLDHMSACFTCEEGQTVFDFYTAERIGARNQGMCPYNDNMENWYSVALSEDPVVEVCCIRKESLKRIPIPDFLKKVKDVKLGWGFSKPRKFATRFVKSKGLADGAGYIGIQWRAEKMTRQWKHWDEFVNQTIARIKVEVDKHTTADGVAPKLYFASDFSKGGSMSYHPQGRALRVLLKVVNQIEDTFGKLVTFSPDEDLPEAIEANNFMMIAVRNAHLHLSPPLPSFYQRTASHDFYRLHNKVPLQKRSASHILFE